MANAKLCSFSSPYCRCTNEANGTLKKTDR